MDPMTVETRMTKATVRVVSEDRSAWPAWLEIPTIYGVTPEKPKIHTYRLMIKKPSALRIVWSLDNCYNYIEWIAVMNSYYDRISHVTCAFMVSLWKPNGQSKRACYY